jgi:hypothetical protein
MTAALSLSKKASDGSNKASSGAIFVPLMTREMDDARYRGSLGGG